MDGVKPLSNHLWKNARSTIMTALFLNTSFGSLSIPTAFLRLLCSTTFRTSWTVITSFKFPTPTRSSGEISPCIMSSLNFSSKSPLISLYNFCAHLSKITSLSNDILPSSNSTSQGIAFSCLPRFFMCLQNSFGLFTFIASIYSITPAWSALLCLLSSISNSFLIFAYSSLRLLFHLSFR